MKAGCTVRSHLIEGKASRPLHQCYLYLKMCQVPMNTIIQFSHVDKDYPPRIQTLHHASFSIHKNEFVFITGPSGSGKTTLLRLMIAAERPSRGQITVLGRPIHHLYGHRLAQLRRQVGCVFQDFRLLPQLSAWENIALSLQIKQTHTKNIRERALAMLEELSLLRKAEALPQHLSGGEQQRIAIARALIIQPSILLADEPTSNLDAHHTQEVMQLFYKLHQSGTTIIFATHDQTLLDKHSYRILQLKAGGVQPKHTDN
jgi:cell division transport system ATP-binding protein